MRAGKGKRSKTEAKAMNDQKVDAFLTNAVAGKDGIEYLRDWLYRKFGKEAVSQRHGTEDGDA